jgi:rhodanese-related sulfurtransferase
MGSIRTVDPREAKRLLDEEGYTYLDVRSVEEFRQGHPEGAVNIPIAHMGVGGMEPNGDFAKVVRANFAPDAKLALGCKSGVRSMRAADVLAAEGYTNLVNVGGGFGGRYSPAGIQAGWVDEGLPVSTSDGDGVSYESLAAKAK